MTKRALEPRVVDVDDRDPLQMESSRVRRTIDLAVAYQELLDLSVQLPVGAGPAAVVRTLLDGLAVILPHRALGACVVPGGTSEAVVEFRLPPHAAMPGRDPTRLFPELSDELISPLTGVRNSTFHVASVNGKLEDDPEEAAFVLRAAEVLASGLRTALALRTARPVSTEVTELRAQVIQSEKLASLGQLVAGVVHELANPVTSIVACTDVLLHRPSDKRTPESDDEHLRRIGVAAERILKFSRDLVAYARPASEAPGPVVLTEVIAQAQGFCEHEFSKTDVTFSADFSAGCPAVLGQAGPLTQVFVNLFTNASHAMTDHGGRLSVRTSVAEGERALTVEVTDTGIGISPDVISRIFEPFFTTKEKGRGSGLGLSIVQEIIEAHAGKIDARSTLGEGTTFTVSLPLYGK